MNLKDFFFPPHCIVCNEVMDSAPKRIRRSGGDALCSNCRAKWEEEKLKECKYCRLPMMDCKCTPLFMRRKFNNLLIKLCAYENRPDSASNRIIFTLKRSADGRAERFVACQLAPAVKKYASIYMGKNTVITNVPRRDGGIIKYGYDHSEILAKNLSLLCGFKYEPILKRINDGTEQKQLTEAQRWENVKDAFEVSKKYSNLKDKCVIIVDDVVTTGASMNACIEKLKEAEVRAYLPVCIAQTTKTVDYSKFK